MSWSGAEERRGEERQGRGRMVGRRWIDGGAAVAVALCSACHDFIPPFPNIISRPFPAEI